MDRHDLLAAMTLAAGKDEHALEIVRYAETVFVEVPWPNRGNGKRFLMPSFVEHLDKDAIVLLMQTTETARALGDDQHFAFRCCTSPLGEEFPNVPLMAVDADISCSSFVIGAHVLSEVLHHKFSRASQDLGALTFDIPFVDPGERVCRHTHPNNPLWTAAVSGLLAIVYEKRLRNQREIVTRFHLEREQSVQGIQRAYYALRHAMDDAIGEPQSSFEERLRQAHLHTCLMTWFLDVKEREEVYRSRRSERAAMAHISEVIHQKLDELVESESDETSEYLH